MFAYAREREKKIRYLTKNDARRIPEAAGALHPRLSPIEKHSRAYRQHLYLTFVYARERERESKFSRVSGVEMYRDFAMAGTRAPRALERCHDLADRARVIEVRENETVEAKREAVLSPPRLPAAPA